MEAQRKRRQRSKPRARRFIVAGALLVALTGAAQTLADNGGGPSWNMIGNDSANSRASLLESTITPANVNRLAVKWIAPTAGDVSATPAVVDRAVYFGGFGGLLRKLDAAARARIRAHP